MTPPPTIRRATPGDAATIAALNADVQAIHAEALPWRFKPPGPDTFPPDAAAALIAGADNLVFLAEVDGAAAGYLCAEIVRRDETSFHYPHEVIYVHHLSVRPAFRRRGVGRALMVAAQESGRAIGIATLAVDVWSFNEPARAFFRGFGLNPFNERLWNR